MQTIIHSALKDARLPQKELAIDILGKTLNRVPYERNTHLSAKAAATLIKVARNGAEHPRLREQAFFLLDTSINNLAFNPTRKIQSLSTHFPTLPQFETIDAEKRAQAEKELQLLPHRIRAIRFRKEIGVLPENMRVFIPSFR